MLAHDSNLDVMDGYVSTITPVNTIITSARKDFNPMIMGAYISNIIKIIPVFILNLFLKPYNR